jgi:hypothetical protein
MKCVPHRVALCFYRPAHDMEKAGSQEEQATPPEYSMHKKT